MIGVVGMPGRKFLFLVCDTHTCAERSVWVTRTRELSLLGFSFDTLTHALSHATLYVYYLYL
jgi:hypothetical protein